MTIKDNINLGKNILSKKNPVSLVFFVTNRCNARCSFCFIDFDDPETFRGELTLDEIDKFTRKLGPSLNNINITGGEPFARKDFYEIVEILFNNTSIDSIFITTNGSLPKRIIDFTNKITQKYKNKKIYYSFSIDSFPEEHNRIRKVKNIFNDCIASYNAASNISKNVETNIAITVTHENYSIVLELYDFLKKKYSIKKITAIMVRDEGIYRIPGSERAPILEAYRLLTNKIKKDIDENEFGYSNSLKSKVMNAKNKISYDNIYKTLNENKYISPCYAGKIFGVIKANGDIYPCEVLEEKIGNLRDVEYDFLKLWYNDKAKKISKDIINNKCFCTYECAWSFNILGNYRYHPTLLKSVLK